MYYKIVDGQRIISNCLNIEVDGIWISNPTAEQIEDAGWEVYVPDPPTLAEVKEQKLQELYEWDQSSYILSFTLNGQDLWVPASERVNFVNTINSAKKLNINTVYFHGLAVNGDDALNILDALNVYAMQVTYVTDNHKANILALDDISYVTNYDFTVGYPQKLSITV